LLVSSTHPVDHLPPSFHPSHCRSPGSMIPLHAAMQKAVILTINQPDFEAALPPLTDRTWAKLSAHPRVSHDENERLEFLGDALMYATIGRMLYAEIPDGTPHLYTNLRSVLHSNATFSHIAERLDIYAVSSTVLRALTMRNFGEGATAPMIKSKPEIKATADLFETVIGAYYLESGFEALCDWMREMYKPLIAAAKRTFYECQSARNRYKRPRHGEDSDHSASFSGPSKKPRLSNVPVARSTVLMNSRVDSSGKASVKAVYRMVTTATPIKKSKGSWGASLFRPTTPRTRTPLRATRGSARRKEPIVIDLTLVSDCSDDESSPVAQRRPTLSDRQFSTMQSRSAESSLPPEPMYKPPPVPPAPAPEDDDDSSEDESMLEQMLSMGVDSGSDMDTDSDSN